MGEVGDRLELAAVVRADRGLDDERQPDAGEDLRALDRVLPGAAHAAEGVVALGVERVERERQAAHALGLEDARARFSVILTPLVPTTTQSPFATP